MAVPMSLISRLQDVFHDALATDEAPERAKVTLAALLVLVSQVDGRVSKVEESGIRALLRSRFSLDDEAVHRVLDEAGQLSGGSDQVPNLSDRILHDVAEEDRPHVLAMAYRMAALDGFVHEFEEDLIWRIGRLLGQSESEIVEIRESALKNLAPERARLA
jgi:uncharacterized tellurite resistance protein B-like protein